VIILIGSKKGGVGKSTLATNMTAFLAAHNKDVILVDADIQRTSSNWYSDRCETDLPQIECVQKYDNIKLTLQNLSKRYEYVIADCQGRDSAELRTGLLAADIVIVPCKPSQADLDTIPIMSDMIKQAREMNEALQAYCVLTMSPTNPVITEIAESREFLTVFSEIQLLDTLISERKVYRDALASGFGVVEMENDKAKLEIESLMKEVLKWQ
jgi:chromosome partitioning protein